MARSGVGSGRWGECASQRFQVWRCAAPPYAPAWGLKKREYARMRVTKRLAMVAGLQHTALCEQGARTVLAENNNFSPGYDPFNRGVGHSV